MAETPAAAGQVTPDASTATTVIAPAAAAAATVTTPAPVQTDPAPTAATAAPVVPDTYELAVPAGAEGWLTSQAQDRFAAIAKSNAWTQAEAQTHFEAMVESLTTEREAVKAATLADPEYGATHWPETQRLAESVINRIRPTGHKRADTFRQLLDSTGYGNHVEVISFLADLGKLMAEDRPGGNVGGSATPTRTTEEILYGKASA
jgi:hypothetical protein